LAFEGERDDLDEAAIVAGNRTIFSAHGILAKHKGEKASRLLRPALFDWFEVRVTQCPAITLLNQLGELLRTAIRWKNSYSTAPDQEHPFGLASHCLVFGIGILKDTGLVRTVAERKLRRLPSSLHLTFPAV